jgi:hypothetical protein
MEHRRPLRVASLEREIKGDAVPYDFVLFGIVVHGGLTKLTAKNEKYITWRVSDLKSGSVTVCIFKRAYEKHKIIGEGTVVAILNPSIWKGDKRVADTIVSAVRCEANYSDRRSRPLSRHRATQALMRTRLCSP